MSGHDPKAATDVSAVLIQLRAPTGGFMLDMMYNKQGNRLTFAYPVGAIVAELFGKIAWFDDGVAMLEMTGLYLRFKDPWIEQRSFTRRSVVSAITTVIIADAVFAIIYSDVGISLG